MTDFSIQEFGIEDYDAAIGIWKRTEGIGLSPADSREGIAVYLARNPGLSFIARANGELRKFAGSGENAQGTGSEFGKRDRPEAPKPLAVELPEEKLQIVPGDFTTATRLRSE